jgi:hypothetical protein
VSSCEYCLGLYKYDTVNKHTGTRIARSVGMVEWQRTEKQRNRVWVPGLRKRILYSPSVFTIGFWAGIDFSSNHTWVVSVGTDSEVHTVKT